MLLESSPISLGLSKSIMKTYKRVYQQPKHTQKLNQLTTYYKGKESHQVSNPKSGNGGTLPSQEDLTKLVASKSTGPPGPTIFKVKPPPP